MSLYDEIQKILGNKKMQKVAKERLQPPIINRVELSVREDHYKSIASETSESISSRIGGELDPIASLPDSKLSIDFSYLANNSSFQRAIIEFIKKFVPGFENVKHRGSKKVMRISFDQNAQNYTNVMNEYKNKVAKLQEKRAE